MAEGTAGADSDIDLLLVRPDDVPDDEWDAQVADLALDISKWTGNDARPIEFSASDLRARRKERVSQKCWPRA
jgi:predicted nucleotidyltransferase